jgi:hypothetical protein
MGSFLELVAVYSGMSCPTDNWQDAKMMENCQNCHACQLASAVETAWEK